MNKTEALVELQRAWSSCRSCGLCDQRNSIVFGYGNPNSQVLIVGEAPGETEDRNGVPFIGAAGQLLDQYLGYTSVRPDIQDLIESINRSKSRSDSNRKDLRNLLLDEFYFTNVVMCFPGNTLVTSPTTIEKGYRRLYQGPITEIGMSNGDQLSGTPNHPVLTPSGWIPIELLKIGDNLICCSDSKKKLSSNPDVQNTPTPFDKLFASLTERGHTDRVIGTKMDFHSDGGTSDIDIITLTRNLSTEGHPSLGKHFASCNSLTLRSETNSFAYQESFHSLPTNPKTSGDILHRLSGQVELVSVTSLQTKEFHGYVHNLTTSEGWYTANGVVVSNCRPAENRDPLPKEMEVCRVRLLEQIYLIDPILIITAGRIATEALVNKKISITSARGELFDIEIPGRTQSIRYPVLAVLHPSYLLRKNDFKQKGGDGVKTYNDFIRAMALVDKYNEMHFGIPVPDRPKMEK